MKSIIYIVCYFGKLPDSIETWLYTCKLNPTINWLIVTDDKTKYTYPSNVSVKYTTFFELKNKIQSLFDFKISLNEPYRLCDFKVSYGEIFNDEIKGYDFWGYCDLDMMWGNVRHFLTDEILESYDKIGFQGHSTLFKNTEENNVRYRLPINNELLYKNAFKAKVNQFFDESGISDIYRHYKIPFYTETNFANISPLSWSFYINYKPQKEDYKNKNQIFFWENGILKRLYVVKNKIYQEEYMYVHFLRRSMTYNFKSGNRAVIYPNEVNEYNEKITSEFIIKHSKNNMFKYYFDLIKRKKDKMNIRNILHYFKCRIKSKMKQKTNNEQIM